MSDAFEARRLSPDDWALFRELRLAALRTDPAAFAAVHADWADLPEAEWRARIADNAVFAILDGARPAGLAGWLRERSSRAAHRAMVVMMWIAPEARGRGAAVKLLDVMAEAALPEGIVQFEVSTGADNAAAQAAYLAAGFSRIGLLPRALMGADGVPSDEVLLVRALDG